MGDQGRVRMTFELCRQMREIAAAGVRSRHPGYSDDEVKWAVIRLTLGDQILGKVYPGIDIAP
jgi:hypothetical protein